MQDDGYAAVTGRDGHRPGPTLPEDLLMYAAGRGREGGEGGEDIAVPTWASAALVSILAEASIKANAATAEANALGPSPALGVLPPVSISETARLLNLSGCGRGFDAGDAPAFAEVAVPGSVGTTRNDGLTYMSIAVAAAAAALAGGEQGDAPAPVPAPVSAAADPPNITPPLSA